MDWYVWMLAGMGAMNALIIVGALAFFALSVWSEWRAAEADENVIPLHGRRRA